MDLFVGLRPIGCTCNLTHKRKIKPFIAIENKEIYVFSFLSMEINLCDISCKMISKREDVYRVIKAVAARGEWKSAEAKRYTQSLVRTHTLIYMLGLCVCVRVRSHSCVLPLLVKCLDFVTVVWDFQLVSTCLLVAWNNYLLKIIKS